uniref:Uncharacterized protein n=1 Tax=Ditylenchus dipsaci TaxID=166011 RepID=A0A915E815_9BILA
MSFFSDVQARRDTAKMQLVRDQADWLLTNIIIPQHCSRVAQNPTPSTVSQHTRDLLIDRYDFEYRDHNEVKGVDGGMDTYLLVVAKESSAHWQTPNSTFDYFGRNLLLTI